MIPILYDADLQDLETKSNGICRLADCTSCVVTEERNGEYTLSLTIPFQGRHADELLVDRIIKALPNDTSQPQCFRIIKVNKDMKDMSLEILANHISYDMSFIPVRPFSATATGRHRAFELLWENTLEDNPFTYEAPDDALTKKLGPSKPTSLRSLLGGVSGSILDLFGGEFEFDNRRVIWHLNRGADNGVTIRYGKNLTSYKQEENIADTVCGIIPFYAQEDTVVYGDIQYCANVANYAVRRTVSYDFTTSFEGEVPTKTQLNEKARSYIDNNPLGVPEVSIHVEFRQLWDSPEYAHIRNLEHVGLCDTVSVYFPQLAVVAKAKVVKTEYDVLLERYNFVELGSVRRNISDRIADVSDQLTRTVTDQEMRIYQNEVNIILADKVSTNVLTAYQATVTNLLASKAEITDLNAHKAEVVELIAGKASVDDLQAVEATVSALQASSVSADYAEATFARVDLANVEDGAIQTAMIGEGVVGTAQIADGSITDAKIVGLTANKITAGTLDAGTIEVVNLNAANITVGTINGSQIASGAITAENLSDAINQEIGNAVDVSSAAQAIANLASNTATAVQTRADNREFDAINIYIHSSEGTAFKNDEISTVMTVTVYHGSVTITTQTGLEAEFGSGAYLQWNVRLYGESNFSSILATDSRLSDGGFAFSINPDDVDTQAVFEVQLVVPDS